MDAPLLTEWQYFGSGITKKEDLTEIIHAV